MYFKAPFTIRHLKFQFKGYYERLHSDKNDLEKVEDELKIILTVLKDRHEKRATGRIRNKPPVVKLDINKLIETIIDKF